MRQTMILTGEINLKTVTDPTVPFGRVTKELGEADLVFANLECLLAAPPADTGAPPGRRRGAPRPSGQPSRPQPGWQA